MKKLILILALAVTTIASSQEIAFRNASILEHTEGLKVVNQSMVKGVVKFTVSGDTIVYSESGIDPVNYEIVEVETDKEVTVYYLMLDNESYYMAYFNNKKRVKRVVLTKPDGNTLVFEGLKVK